MSVAEVLKRPVTEFDEFTGRLVAVERVEVRPRVSGYISSVSLTPGREVKKGDLLFTIDPRPYEAGAQGCRRPSSLAPARSSPSRDRTRARGEAARRSTPSRRKSSTRVRPAPNRPKRTSKPARPPLDTAALNLVVDAGRVADHRPREP